MVTPTHSQPLLNSSNTTLRTTKKILFFSLSTAAFFSISYLVLLIIPSKNISKTPSLCDKSHDPTSCFALISEIDRKSPRSDGQDLLGKILSNHVSHINSAIKEATKTKEMLMMMSSQKTVGALKDCIELMDLSRDRVISSIKSLTKSNSNRIIIKVINDDVSTWLSAVLTNHVTCLDLLQEHHPHNLFSLRSILEGLITKGRAILAIHSKVAEGGGGGGESGFLLEASGSRRVYPSWVRRRERKLLEASGSEIAADVVVAKDGSGNFTTVAEAVATAPVTGTKRYVIYVKAGVYEENVLVGKKQKNVMIVGDGMNQSVITGSLNVIDGSTTFNSATLAAVGDGFILQDICIQNTAGPEKHQAVALRVGADQSVINRCKLDAYQDTLYAHSLRQFYRDSIVTGTVDFIFGNAAAVFQNCDLVARKPMANQKNMVTAQGRIDPNQNTGTSIQYCQIVASPDLEPVRAQFPTFLGRPWKNFSRTVVMQSSIGDHIDPSGWAEWDGDFALDTLYYGEYKNTGPGADTSKRVNWTGYHIITDPTVARQFTVGEFIQGQEWLDSAGVTYAEGL